MDLAAEFSRHFRGRFPDLTGQSVLVALSGGSDSVALLHLLSAPELELRLEAAYVHHGWRGVEADQEAALCARLCEALEVPFHLLEIDTGTQPLPEGRESQWRRLRYQALLTLARRRGLPFVATGHQRDDIAEGVLMQLLRGGGPRALAGIAERTPQGVIRPLLPFRRQQLAAWLSERHLVWCEDSSNRSQRHLRNRVRLEVLPGLEAVSHSVRDHLVHLAADLAESEAFLAEELERRAGWIDPWHPYGGVARERVASLPSPLRARWLHEQALRASIGRVTRRQLVELERLLADGRPSTVTLADRWCLRLARGRLWLEPPGQPQPYELRLEPGCEVSLPIGPWRVRVLPPPVTDPVDGWRALVPSAARLTVRSPGPADTVVDGRGRRRVSRLLGATLPRHLRASWPALWLDDRISWIPAVWQSPAMGDQAALVVEVSRQ